MTAGVRSRTAGIGPCGDGPAPRLAAVVELGSTSIRMAIAQIGEGGKLRTLEALQQGVSLGRDTFSGGSIGLQTTEDCVNVLRRFGRILEEYQVRDDRRIAAVATSAVREAANRQTFLDRIYMATGIDVRVLDDAEVNRFTTVAVQPLILSVPALCEGNTLAVEVGGGSTETLLFADGRLLTSRSFRLGSFRLRSSLGAERVPLPRIRDMIDMHVERAVQQIAAALPSAQAADMLALGGDARFAAMRLLQDWRGRRVVALPTAKVQRLAGEVLELSVDDVVRRHHVSFPEAETLGPALLIYARMARVLGVKRIHVGAASLRDGILAEMAGHGAGQPAFEKAVIEAARQVARRYGEDREHAEYVTEVARAIFDALTDEHGLDARHRLLLTVASLLHDVGSYVSSRSHHKHSMYLIANSEIFGIGARDLELVSLVARYHRRAEPRPTHVPYVNLPREDRVCVLKLASILRVADAVGRGHAKRRRPTAVRRTADGIEIAVSGAGDLALEEQALREKGQMFEHVYGMGVVLKTLPGR